MAQKEIIEKGVKTLLIALNVRSKTDPSIRLQARRKFPNIKVNSPKANKLEKQLIRETERRLAEKEGFGITWSNLLAKYFECISPRVQRGEWVQSKQTFSEAIKSLEKWTSDWDNTPASQISSGDVKRLFYQMKGQGISDSWLGKLRGDIKKVYEFGICENLLKGMERSPTDGVALKTRSRKRKEILSTDEIKKLLAYAREYEPDWYYIWAFAIYTGARNGELFALKWTDLDEGQGLIHIQRSYNKKTKEYKSTKTGEWRDVSICTPLKEVIKELKQRKLHDLARGVNVKYQEYILPRPGIWQNGEQAKKLRLFCEEIGLPGICFHSLRACFATELLKRGVPVASVMRVGGWASMKTMMHYVRLSGIEVRGITDPLDFRTARPSRLKEGKTLMEVVGQSFDASDVTNVVPLMSRNLPRKMN